MSHSCCHHSQTASPREALMEEHRVIEVVLDAVERMTSARIVDRGFVENALDFFCNFADGCHHAKEEDIYFPELERKGVPREGGPIGCMLREHEEGRSLLRAAEASLPKAAADDPQAAEALRSALAQYVTLLRQHIHKEDDILFVMGESALTPPEKAAVVERFNQAEAGGEAGKHERYVALAAELARRNFAAAA